MVAREKALFRDDRERLEATAMKHPIDSKKAFGYFGLMMGSMPPLTIAIRLAAQEDGSRPIGVLFIILMILAGIVSGSVGYLAGQLMPSILGVFRDLHVLNKIAMFSLVGFAWGATAGVSGGTMLFVLGALFAGVAGGLVGAVVVPVFSLLHNTLRRGDLIEVKHLLPISFALALILCAFILGV